MSRDKQSSSIDWILDWIEDVDLTPELWEKIKKQAKAMHKEEIMKAFNKGNQMGNSPFADSEWYYMIKFGGNNEQ